VNVLFGIFGFFVQQPWLASVPAVLLAVVAYYRRSRFAWVVAALWLIYAVYEFAISIRLLCSGECNIRVDLLLLAPLLAALSLVACVVAGRKIRTPPQPSDE
jgi:hypothetical protein